MLLPTNRRRGAGLEMNFIAWQTSIGMRRLDRTKDADPTVLYMPRYREGWADDQERDREARASIAKEERRLLAVEERAFQQAFKFFRGEVAHAPEQKRRGPKPAVPDWGLGPLALAKRLKAREASRRHRSEQQEAKWRAKERERHRAMALEEAAKWQPPPWIEPKDHRELAKRETDNWFKRNRRMLV